MNSTRRPKKSPSTQKMNLMIKAAFFAVLVVGLTLAMLLVRRSQDVRQQAAGAFITVCPTGIVGQNGCNYIGGDGIQQAVDAAPDNSTIVLRQGEYARAKYTVDGGHRYFLLINKNKNLTIVGEGSGAVISGVSAPEHASTGIEIRNGQVNLENLEVSEFTSQSYNCFEDICAHGIGISVTGGIVNGQKLIVKNNEPQGILVAKQAKVYIKNSDISANYRSGAYVFSQAELHVINSKITSNGSAGLSASQDGVLISFNNVIYNNKGFGIYSYSDGNQPSNPSISAINNIIANTIKVDNEPGVDFETGFSIGGQDATQPDKLANDNFYNNVVWGNQGGDNNCGSENHICDYPNRIVADPLFTDPNNNNFQVLQGSPALNSGDKSIYPHIGLYLEGDSPSPTPLPKPTSPPGLPTPHPSGMPSPKPTPVISPTPGMPPYNIETSINFNIMLDGVPVENNLAFLKEAGRSPNVRVFLEDQEGKKQMFLKQLVLTPQLSNIQVGRYALSSPVVVNNLMTGKYNILVKGPMHKQMRYCVNSQASNHSCLRAEGIMIHQGETKVYDFTKKPLACGDLPIHSANKAEQDGIVNVLDYSFMLNCLSKRNDKECVARADCNYDGVISNQDMDLLLKTLSSAHDE